MTQTSLDLDPTSAGFSHPGQMRLARIQLHNWGTFDKRHDLAVPRSGLLLTGESGSGKSSILDAISAVLMKPGETRFNAAAQDGPAGDRDRSPMSYVRGAYRRHTDDATGEVRPGYLRQSTTVSGIALTFEDGQGRVVTAMRVMHVAGRSAAAVDLRSAFVLFDREAELADVLRLCDTGIDRRRLKQQLSPQAAEDSYTRFGVHLRRLTGIGSEDAQRLLHRTQAAKSLTSLDELLRGFMLETPSTFALADQAVEQFRALQDAHSTVIDAREQIEALLPQREQWQVHRAATVEQEQLSALLSAVGTYRYTRLAELAQKDLSASEVELAAAAHERDRARRVEDDAREAERRARQALDDRGGTALQVLESRIEQAEDLQQRVRDHVARITPVLERLGSPMPCTAEELATAQAQAQREQERIDGETGGLTQSSAPVHVEHAEATRRRDDLIAEIRSLNARRSNLPASLVEVRDQLAQAAGESPASLPFAGELMNVRDTDWQGAVERLLSGLSTTILVPERLYPAVARAVDARHWNRRISYERVRESARHRHDAETPAQRTVLSVLELAASPFQTWLRDRISSGFQHVLVDDAQQMARHERALSRAGQVKNRDRHIKDDRHRISDRDHWVIGTDNAALLDLRRQQLETANAEIARSQQRLADMERQRLALRDRFLDLVQLTQLSWDDIDADDVDQRLGALRQQRQDLLADADMTRLEILLRTAEEDHARARDDAEQARNRHHDLSSAVDSAAADLQRAREELADAHLDPEHREQLDRRVRAKRRTLGREQLPDVISEVSGQIRDDLDQVKDQIRSAESALALARARYLRQWAERSVNLVDDIAATPDFLAQLSRLESDRLPEFEHRFRDLLRTQSQNNIGQLRADIAHAIRDVQQRLGPVDESLRATPFDTERRTWLTLIAHQRLSDEAKTFLGELMEITHGAFHQDDESVTAAEERFARMDRVLRRLGSAESADQSWRKRVLDTRRHVEFEAREIDAEGEVVDVYKGSDGRSGGQRQRLVTFCLAAALRYQLTSSADGFPAYGLVVLDEAFDKTDIHFTRAGLEVFRSFGFQLLLATPLKMLQTIEEYVGGAAVVSNPTGRASRLSAVAFTDMGSGPHAHA